MTDYKAPPPEVAEFVYQKNLECEEQRQRLKSASADDAWAVATNTSESDAARLEGILILALNRDPRIPELVLNLFDESDLSVWRSVIRSIHPDDSRIRSRLRQFASTSDDTQSAAEALCVLAQMRDENTVSVCKQWFDRSQGERNAAVEALRILGTDPAVELLEARWRETQITEEDRNTVALALVHFNHNDAINYVDELAGKASCSWSVAAATALYLRSQVQGLNHMLNILETGTLEAKQSMVGQISSLAGHLPHEYTADGIHEARLWVETELANAS